MGKALVLALGQRGYPVTAVSSRSPKSAADLASLASGCKAVESAQDVANSCDVVFITSPDDAISQIATQVRWRPEKGVVHCSGAHSLEVLEPAANQAAATGSFHPFQTFACIYTTADAAERFQGAGVAIEGTGWIAKYLNELASDLGCKAVHIDPKDRALYHASAVMSCGYLAALLKDVVDIWEVMGVPREEALSMIMPIVNSTSGNVTTAGIDASVTGPVPRGDTDTVRRHLDALEARLPRLVPLYRCLALEGLAIATPNLEPEVVKKLEQLLQAR